MSELIVGVNAWLEETEAPSFRPVQPGPGSAYSLFIDVAMVPYGGPRTVATWYSAPLARFLEECAAAGEDRELTIEVGPRHGVIGSGPLVATARIAADRVRAAAAHDLAQEELWQWLQAQSGDYRPETDVLGELRNDPEAPFSIVRFRLAVETGPVDNFSLDLTLRGGGADADTLESNTLLKSVTWEGDTFIELPWGAGPEGAAEKRRTEIVDVFYATDRRNTGDEQLPRRYSGQPSEPFLLEHGVVRVNVPIRRHQEGKIERPWLRCLEDPEHHFVLWSIKVLDREGFFTDLAASTTESKQAFVFIHGYNVDFEEAAFRTAQIHVDLRDHHQVAAVPLLYSWPSLGEAEGYDADQDQADETVQHLAAFLRDVRERSGAELVHLIAHSMGNRALTLALKELAGAAPGEALFNEVVLAAPDLSVRRFRQLAAEIREAARRFTLYANSEDLALKLSAGKRVGRQRVGEAAGDEIVVVPGVESIDATNLDTGFIGHSYAAENERMLQDLSQVFGGRPPAGAERKLVQNGDGDRRWWSFHAGRRPLWKRLTGFLFSSADRAPG